MEVISLGGFRMILGPDLIKALGETHMVQTSSTETSNLQGAQLKTRASFQAMLNFPSTVIEK